MGYMQNIIDKTPTSIGVLQVIQLWQARVEFHMDSEINVVIIIDKFL